MARFVSRAPRFNPNDPADRIARKLLADLQAGTIARIGGETVEQACDEVRLLTGVARERFVMRTLRRLIYLTAELRPPA